MESRIEPPNSEGNNQQVATLPKLSDPELDGIHPRIHRELSEVTAKLFLVIYQQSWSPGEVPEDFAGFSR